MRAVSNIVKGFKRSFRFRRVAGYIMLIQAGLSVLVALLSINYVNTSIGRSTNLMKIIEGYNHDVFQDLLLYESTGWEMIKTLIALTVFVYLMLGPLISGGLFNAYHKESDHWNVFWKGGSRFYFSFLKLNVLILLILLICAGIIGFGAITFATHGLENFVSEVPVLIGVGVALFVAILFGIYLVSVSARIKWQMIENDDKRVWANFRLGLKNLKNKRMYLVVLGFLFLLLSAVVAFFSNALINCIPESGFALMLLAFVIQILVLFFKVFLRNAYQAAIIE